METEFNGPMEADFERFLSWVIPFFCRKEQKFSESLAFSVAEFMLFAKLFS